MKQFGSFLNPVQLLLSSAGQSESNQATTEEERLEKENEARREEEALKEKLEL